MPVQPDPQQHRSLTPAEAREAERREQAAQLAKEQQARKKAEVVEQGKGVTEGAGAGAAAARDDSWSFVIAVAASYIAASSWCSFCFASILRSYVAVALAILMLAL